MSGDSNDYGSPIGMTARQKTEARKVAAKLTEPTERQLAQHALDAWSMTYPRLRRLAVELQHLSDDEFRVVVGTFKAELSR